MTRKKKILFVILFLFIGIQFIQLPQNKSEQGSLTDVTKTIGIPENVQVLLKTSCYDCHSNNTIYPWYDYIQPVGWWLNKHIQNGKSKLNFNNFGSYSMLQQQKKLKSIVKEINSGGMPLTSYTLIHRYAILSVQDKALIIDWVQKVNDSLMKKIKRCCR